MKIDNETAEAAVLGGAILGGGGGGWIEEGRTLARLALDRGFSEIHSLEEIPEDTPLLTVSAVGAPSAGSSVLDPEDYVRAVGLFEQKAGTKIGGLISSEIGALGVVNGWLQSAALDIPVIDAPCNGRAHPLGLMGSMGLTRKRKYVSLQTAVGGSVEKGNRVEAFFEGSLTDVSKMVRKAAVKAGGMVAVARNLVPSRYVKDHGAPGAVRMAVELGKTFLKKTSAKADPEETISRVVAFLGAKFVIQAVVTDLGLEAEAGLDVGRISLRGEGEIERYELTFWNEYMTLEREGERIATFPDLIMTLEAGTSRPLVSAEVKKGDKVFLLAAPARKLILGAGMRDRRLLGRVERAVGKAILKYGD